MVEPQLRDGDAAADSATVEQREVGLDLARRSMRQRKTGESQPLGLDDQLATHRLPERQLDRFEPDLTQPERAKALGGPMLDPAIGRITRPAHTVADDLF